MLKIQNADFAELLTLTPRQGLDFLSRSDDMAGNKQTRKIVTSESSKSYLFTSATRAKIPDANTRLLVSEVEQLTGVSKSKLRRYEETGVLCPTRTGEGVSNNRKLYGVEDLERLQAIITLREYDFSLQEIGPILENEIDLYDALSEKLIELKRRENQLRNLGLFAHFAEAAGSDLIESLGVGPAEFDSLADLMRDTSPYEAALAKLETYTDDEAEHAFVDLDKILLAFPYIDKTDSFMQTSEMTGRFIAWWNSFVWPINELGYLGFWAVYEDHTLVPERIQIVAGPDYTAYLEMFVFFQCVMNLFDKEEPLMKAIARTVDEDVVAAIEDLDKLSHAIINMLVGSEIQKSLSAKDCYELVLFTLEVIEAFVQDKELSSYLGIAGSTETNLEESMTTPHVKNGVNTTNIPDSNDLEHVIAMLVALGGDEEGV